MLALLAGARSLRRLVGTALHLRPLLVSAILVGALVAVGVPGAAAAESVVPLETAALPCAQAIGIGNAPGATTAKVLNKVGLPRRTISSGGTTEFPEAPRHWFKQGLVIRGSTFTLTVPDAWREHLAIGWGSPAQPSERVTVDGCTWGSANWIAYAGGFWVDKNACVPLIVEAGGHRKTVHVSLGKSCASR